MNNKLIIVAITLFIALCLCACVSTSGSFSYVHDPRLNAEAMKDIVENPFPRTLSPSALAPMPSMTGVILTL